MAERDLLAYLDDTTPNPTNAQGRDLLSYLDKQEASIQPQQGSAGLSTNLFQYDPSKYDIGGIQPHELDNLGDIRARNQGVLDALGRSTANLIGKTGINVIGGTLGTIYGAGAAIANGEISKLWDNDLTSVLDKASEAIGDTFRVYKSADYEERSLLGRLFTHPIQFTDEFMDTLSFTTGAVVTELLTAGLASATIVPRALKYLKYLDRGAEAAEAAGALRAGGLAAKIGNAGTLTRQLATGAAWEASVEARHGAIDMKESMYADALNEFGVSDINQLPEEVIYDIEDRAANAGLFTFLTNMALVGGSNLVQFPKIFGAGYNTTKRSSNALGRIIKDETGKYIDAFSELSRGQNIVRNLKTALKNPFMEGIVEEGGQSVLSQTAGMYWDRKNDEEAKSEVEKFLNSFGTALKDTYTTGEGWYEIGMGMLIGSLGAPGRGLIPGQRGVDPETGERRELWTGGIAGSFQERAAEDAEIASLVERINNSPELMASMQANYNFLTTAASIQPAQDRALERDDTFMFENYRDDMLHSWIDSRIQAGLSSDLDTQVDQLRKIDAEDFYVSFRGEEQADKASTEDKTLFKQRMISNLESQINNTREAYNIVDNNYFGNNEDLKQELIYNVASAKNIDIREQNINRAVSDLTSGSINDLFLRRADERKTVNSYIKELENRLNLEETTAEEEIEIQTALNKYKGLDDKTTSLSLDEYNQLDTFISTKPVEASLNLNTVIKMMNDSRKLRRRRQAFIETYNKLFTEQGQKEFQELQENIRKVQEQLLADQTKKEEAKEQAKTAKKERADVKKKAAKQKEGEVAQEVEEDDELNLVEATQDDEVAVEQIEPSEETSADVDIVEPTTEESVLEEPEIASTEPTQTLEERAEEIWRNDVNEKGFPNRALSEVVEELRQQEAGEQSLLTPEEQAVLTSIESEEQSEKQDIDIQEGFTNNISEEAENSLQDIVYEGFQRTVGNTITSLNIEYSRTVREEEGQLVESSVDLFDSEGNLRIVDNFDSRLQDPKQFKQGDKVNIIFPTYQQIAERGIVGEYTEEQYNKDIQNPEMIPIAFIDSDNKIIGYLPTIENVGKNVIAEKRDVEVIENKKLRNYLVNNIDKNITFTITRKSSGIPMYSKNKGSIYNKLGDGNSLGEGVEIAIFKSGSLLRGENSPVTNQIKLPNENIYPEEYFKEGVVYTIIPTADDINYYALPATVSRVSENDAEAILHMVDLFVSNSDSIIAERKRLSSEVDFSDIGELMKSVENILYVNNKSDNHIFKLSIDKNNRKLRLGTSKDRVFELADLNKSNTRDAIKNELQKRYYAVKTSNMNKPYTGFSFNTETQQLDVDIYNVYNDYLNDKSIITTNLQSEPIENTDRRYYTAQSVIEISSPLLIETEEAPLVTEAPLEESPRKLKNPLGARFRGNTGKPPIMEDFDAVVKPNATIEELAEDLMRTCNSK